MPGSHSVKLEVRVEELFLLPLLLDDLVLDVFEKIAILLVYKNRAFLRCLLKTLLDLLQYLSVVRLVTFLGAFGHLFSGFCQLDVLVSKLLPPVWVILTNVVFKWVEYFLAEFEHFWIGTSPDAGS